MISSEIIHQPTISFIFWYKCSTWSLNHTNTNGTINTKWTNSVLWRCNSYCWWASFWFLEANFPFWKNNWSQKHQTKKSQTKRTKYCLWFHSIYYFSNLSETQNAIKWKLPWIPATNCFNSTEIGTKVWQMREKTLVTMFTHTI